MGLRVTRSANAKGIQGLFKGNVVKPVIRKTAPPQKMTPKPPATSKAAPKMTGLINKT